MKIYFPRAKAGEEGKVVHGELRGTEKVRDKWEVKITVPALSTVQNLYLELSDEEMEIFKTKMKCLGCGKEMDSGFCWDCHERKGDCYLRRKDFETINKLVHKIFEFYPGAIITGFFLGGKDCIIHFRALGYFGSDSVHVRRTGELWQTLSGDLELGALDKLEEELRNIINPIPNLAPLFK